MFRVCKAYALQTFHLQAHTSVTLCGLKLDDAFQS